MSIQKEGEDRHNFVKSFAKGLSVLAAFDEHNREMSLSEVSKKVGISRAAARRFLLTLEETGFATQQNKKFSLTYKVHELTKGAKASVDIWEIAKSHMKDLVSVVDEACSAAILDGNEIEYVARIGTPHRIMSVAPKVGSRFPAHMTSTGRAILAFSPQNVREHYYKNASFSQYTKFSVTNVAALRVTLHDAVEQGYVILDQELEIGLRSIAVPLWGTNDDLLGALTIGTHISHVSQTRLIEEILPQLKLTAIQIKQALS